MNQKGFAQVIILIGVIILLISGAAWWYIRTYYPHSAPRSYSIPTQPSQNQDKTSVWKIYKDDESHISFQYPNDWIVKVNINKIPIDLCDLHRVDPTNAPKASVRFGACEGSEVTPAATITYNEYLTILPSSFQDDGNAPIQLSYYDNPEKLSIQDFNNKYLTSTVGGDPINIWAPNYEEIVNPNGVHAYYDKEHYCVATCQIYVWSKDDKIFKSKNFPNGIPNQETIFTKVFSTFKFTQ